MNSPKKYGLIILAAGSSSRLGQPKQQLHFKESSLLEHMVNIALGANVAEVFIVINETLKDLLPAQKATILVNEDAVSGLSSSIRKGILSAQEKLPDMDAVILMPCDQPFVTTAILNELLAQHKSTGKGIVAARYAGTFGTPALFQHHYFDQLLCLKGDTGARPIMKEHIFDMAYVDFPQGEMDIDTPEDLKNLGIMQ
ncbi:NTP transferase domain-containing protein [Ferruginibacter sp. HRS2-29]|uniref:nucleotidyltransferase family protein n=1 Tax=Ferruginibacter sp. HRS2-29 TaxID=2487334 RepID=UPI0020CCEB40|nr:nucleotidyltransferase family protein [Ferruginibacter sp. HRS2-29]